MSLDDSYLNLVAPTLPLNVMKIGFVLPLPGQVKLGKFFDPPFLHL